MRTTLVRQQRAPLVKGELTAITNALENGTPIEKLQQLAGHCDIRTTQLYFRPSAKDSEDAARHIQIR